MRVGAAVGGPDAVLSGGPLPPLLRQENPLWPQKAPWVNLLPLPAQVPRVGLPCHLKQPIKD